jgi:hypothetical protein
MDTQEKPPSLGKEALALGMALIQRAKVIPFPNPPKLLTKIIG